jgi:hypothetical protein
VLAGRVGDFGLEDVPGFGGGMTHTLAAIFNKGSLYPWM